MICDYVFDNKSGKMKRIVTEYDDTQSFIMPTCTDDSKFIPDVSSTKQYNGNATGTEPQYDMQTYTSNGDISTFSDTFRIATIRKSGWDIAEIEAFEKNASKGVEKGKKMVKDSIDKIKDSGFADKTLSNHE